MFRPYCLRCVKHGIDCGGYPQPPVELSSALEPSPEQVPAMRTLRPKPVDTPYSVSMNSLHLNEDEYRYFNIFVSKTVFEILPIFGTESFRQSLLQACDSAPSIRYIVIALGAMDKTSQAAAHFSDGKKTRYLLQHRHNALKQYASALKHTREVAGSGMRDIQLTILTCLMILCFEAWNGNHPAVVTQIKLGFSLIKDNNDLGYGNSLSSSSFGNELTKIFSRLDIQLLSFAEDRALAVDPFVGPDSEDLLQNMPLAFTSLEEADKYGVGNYCAIMPILFREFWTWELF